MNALMPASKPGESIQCRSCSHDFPQDPIYEVPCPVCKAAAGTYCKRPSEHSGPFVPFHAERDIAALQQGYYDHTGNTGCGPNSNSIRARQIIQNFYKHG